MFCDITPKERAIVSGQRSFVSFLLLQLSNSFLRILALPNKAVFCHSHVLIVTPSFSSHASSLLLTTPSAPTTTGTTSRRLITRSLPIKYTSASEDSCGIYRLLSWSTSMPQVKRIAVHDEYLSSHECSHGKPLLGTLSLLKAAQRTAPVSSKTIAFCDILKRYVQANQLRLVYLSLGCYNFAKHAQLRCWNTELNTKTVKVSNSCKTYII